MSCCPGSCTRKQRQVERIEALRRKVSRNPETPNDLFGDPAFSDFKIVAHGRIFFVTKYQLALKSKVFEKMFRMITGDGLLQLEDDAEVVEVMLEYVFLGRHVREAYLAAKVAIFAYRAEMQELKDQCELELVDTLDPKDALETLQMAREMEMPVLFAKCIEILHQTFEGFKVLENAAFPISVLTRSSDEESPAIKVFPEKMNSQVTLHWITNIGNCNIALKVYTDPNYQTSHPALILQPMKSHPLLLDGWTAVFYTRYMKNDEVDYNKIHLLPTAKSRFFR